MAVKSKARHDLTLRSIKREIGAGRDVAYWLDKAYTHLDNGLLTGDDITEIEILAQAYYDALDKSEDDADNIDSDQTDADQTENTETLPE
jgi:hypothetical protein